MSEKLTGIITKSVGGVYTVDVSTDIYVHNYIECKARGIFRKNNISPVCADRVVVECQDGSNVISEILPRRSLLIRPPLANLDNLVFVNSTAEPSPNLLLLDKFIAIAVYKKINPIVVFTKVDLRESKELEKIYKNAGIDVFSVDNTTGQGYEELKEILQGKISAFTGNTGVGKSSLLNNIFPNLSLATNEISKKLGRGKHTTRHVELYPLENGGFIADTPGFSSFETNQYDIIFKQDLADCFCEFKEYVGNCRFLDCSHTKEKGCAVIKAVENGEISQSRYNNYVSMYEEAKQLKEWEYKK